MASGKNSYQSILGNAFLSRARNLFLIGLIMLFITSTVMVYAGVASGELRRRIIDPAQHAVDSVISSLQQPESSPSSSFEYDDATSKTDTEIRSNVRVEINNTAGASGDSHPAPTVIYYQYPTNAPAQSDSPSYEEKTQQMQEMSEQHWQEALKRQEEFRQQSEQNLDDFEALSEKCAAEFSANQGMFVSDECKNL